MKIEDLEVYNMAMKLGDDIWKIVEKQDPFVKNTLGYQITRSADSVALNISEGFGRYHYKENKNFCLYSRVSLSETKTCLTKFKNRKLINEPVYEDLIKEIELLNIKLNAYIKSIGRKIDDSKD